MYKTTLAGRFVMTNAAMARILGYDSPEDLVSTVTDIAAQLYVEPELRRRLVREVPDFGLSGLECQLYRKDGTKVWVRLDARAVRDESGSPSHFEGIAEDISAFKESEQVLGGHAAELALINASLEAEIAQRKRAEQMSKRQTAALARAVELLAARPELDAFIGQVAQVIADQLGASNATLWLYDEAREDIWMHLELADGRIRDHGVTDHPCR